MERASIFHTHIDCSNGLSAQSFYQVCRDLAEEMRAEAAKTDERILHKLLENVGLLYHKDGVLLAVDNQELWIDRIQQEQQQSLRRPTDDDSNDQHCLSRSVLTSALGALTLCFPEHDEPSKAESPSAILRLAGESIYFSIVGSFWWFNLLGIGTSVSCSPVPCSPSQLSKRPKLLKGMTVKFVEDAQAVEVTHGGVAVLRVLLANCLEDFSKVGHPALKFFYVASALGSATIAVGERAHPVEDCKALIRVSAEQSGIQNDDFVRPDLWNVDRNLSLLETNIDDMTAEHLAFAMELLIQHTGVADCWITPITMKKGRGAHMLHCLCRNERCADVLQVIFRHCTTIGVRVQNHKTGLSRVALRRSALTVPILISLGSGVEALQRPIDCKLAYLGAEVVSIKAEFDQCKQISLESGGTLTLQRIHELAIQKARSGLLQFPMGSPDGVADA